MTELTLDLALIKLAALDTEIDAAKLNDSFDQEYFKQEFRSIFEQTSLAQLDGSKPLLTVLYSGYSEFHTHETAKQIAFDNIVNNQNTIAIIDNTHAGQLAESEIKGIVLNKIFDNDSDSIDHFMNSSRIQDPENPGVFDNLSERFAQLAEGKIISLTPDALAEKIYNAAELPALLDNPSITEINGISKTQLGVIYEANKLRLGDSEKAIAFLGEVVNYRSAELLNGERTYLDGETTKLANFGTIAEKIGIYGLANTPVNAGDLNDAALKPFAVLENAEAGGLIKGIHQISNIVGIGVFDIILATSAIALAYADSSEAGQQELNDQAFGLGVGLGILSLATLTALIFPASAPVIAGSLVALGLVGIAYELTHIVDLLNNLDIDLTDWFDPLWDDHISPLIGLITDPLVLDLDGDGIELTALDGSNVYFDLTGDGRAERTGWVSGDDGFLVIDLNNNGVVDGIGELFGSSQTDGFAVLERFDSNGDGVIDENDEAFAQLRVWRDLNQNGQSDAGELITLAEAGIVSISLSSLELGTDNNGHTAARAATFTFSNGSTGSIQSIFFQTDNQDTILDNTPDFTVDPVVANLPQLNGSGQINSIAYKATNDAVFAADWQALTDNADSLSFSSLRAQFTDLLLRWAGVEDVIEGSRGQYVDAQHIAFVEKFFGNPYQEIYDGNVLQNSPGSQAFGDQIEASFQSIVTVLLTMFSSQVALSIATRSGDITDFIAHDFFANAFLQFSNELSDDAAPEATLGNVGGVMQLIAETTPEYYGDAINHIEKSLGLMEGMVFVAFGGDRDAYAAAMADGVAMIADENVRKIADAIVSGNAAFGSSDSDGMMLVDGDSLFIGGEGDDVFVSSEGEDTFIYRTGDGSDYIRDTSISLDEVDVLELVDLTQDDLTFENVAESLIIKIAGTDDEIVVEGFFTNWLEENKGIDLIRLSDGSTMNREDIRALTITTAFENSTTIIDSDLDDVIVGNQLDNDIEISEGNDTVIFGQGGGSDTIYDTSGDIAETDIVKLANMLPDDVEFVRYGEALVITNLATGETLTDAYFFSDSSDPDDADGWNNHGFGIDQIEFSNGVTWDRTTIANAAIIKGTDGRDSLEGSGLDDNFEGGAQHDTFAGEEGSDTYYWSKGDGYDTIVEDDNSTVSHDRIVLQDVSVSDVSISRVGDTLRILVNSTGELIQVVDQFRNMDLMTSDTTQTGYGIESLEFANGIIWDRQTLAASTGGASVGKEIDIEYYNVPAGNAARYYVDELGSGGDIILIADHAQSASGSGSTESVRSTIQYGSDVSVASETVFEFEEDELPQVMAPGDNHIIIGSDLDDSMALTDISPVASGEDPSTDASSSDGSGGGGSTAGGGSYQVDLDTSGSNTIMGRGGSDVLLGGLGNDYLSGGEGNDVLFGDEASSSGSGQIGLDILDGDEGDDILYGGAGVDLLFGGDGADQLYGGDHNDHLEDGSEEDDIFEGGRGDDYIESTHSGHTVDSGNGNDTFIYSRGDGNDIISDGGHTLSEVDRLIFTDITSSDVEIAKIKDTDDIVITDTVTGQTITIWGFLWSFDTRALGIDEIVFSDGTIWDRDQILSATHTIRGTSGDDELWEDDEVDNVFIAGEGDDLIASTSAIGSSNRGFDNGNDTFIYSRGDGNDIIVDGSHSTTEIDRLILTDINSSEIELTQLADTYDLQIEDLVTQQTITIYGFFWSFDSVGQGIDEVEFADGEIWGRDDLKNNTWIRGTVTVDTIDQTESGDENFIGDLGDDIFFSGDGSDTFVYRSGDGNDQIIEEGEIFDDIDTLKFIDLFSTDLRLEVVENTLEIFVVPTDETIYDLIAWWHRDTFARGVDVFEFADGEIWDRDDITYWATQGSTFYTGDSNDNIITGSYLDQNLTGLEGDDIIETGSGSDIVFGNSGDDVLKVSSVQQGDLNQLDGGGGQDTADFSGLNQAIFADLVVNDGEVKTEFVAGYDVTFAELTSIENVTGTNFDDEISGDLSDNKLEGLAGNDVLYGGSGNDTLIGGDGDDLLIGYLGDDVLSGGDGNDVYEFSSAGGVDVIVESNNLADVNEVHLTDLLPEDIILKAEADNLLIGVSSTSAQLTITDYFLSTNSGISKIVFSDGSFWDNEALIHAIETAIANDQVLVGDDEENILYSGSGNDTLQGFDGSDTYIFDAGDGQDIIEESGWNDTDQIIIRGYSSSEARYSYSDNATLIISFVGSTDQITVVNTLGGDRSDEVEQIIFEDDGVTLSSEQYRNLAIAGVVTDGDDLVTGFDEDEILEGGLGNDTLSGFDGSDTYIFNAGDGQDIIEESGWNDTDQIVVRGYSSSEARYSYSDNATLIISFVGSTDQITVVNTLGGDRSDEVEQIIFEDDGVTLSSEQYRNLAIAGVVTDGDDLVTGFDEDEILEGGLGNDTLSGFDGSDTYIFNAGDGQDIIEESGWNDTDQIVVRGYSSSEARYSYSDNATLIISFVGSTDQITVVNTLGGDRSDEVEQIIFEDDGVTIEIDDIVPLANSSFAVIGDISDNLILSTTTGDRLIGHGGNDIFVFSMSNGHDTIADFSAGASSEDIIEIQGMSDFDTYSKVLSVASDNGVDTTITLDVNNTITLEGVLVMDLHEDDFQFV